MAASADSPSPSNVSHDTGLMGSSPLANLSSDKCFWSALRNRVDALLEDRQNRVATGLGDLDKDVSFNSSSDFSGPSIEVSNRAKKMKEDSLLLLRGFDSIAHTLSKLSNNIGSALQGARTLAEPPTLSEMFHCNLKSSETPQGDAEEQQREEPEGEKKKGLKRKFNSSDDGGVDQGNEPKKENDQSPKARKLKKAKNLAISLASKAASLGRELKSIKSDLCFVRERCALLEEENSRLREGFADGIRPEEDDMMRLQMEALLAEKSRLANENANLVRENQCLRQLVEYHQLTTQDLSASYEQIVQGICLDFSSPSPTAEQAHNADNKGEAETPQTNLFGFSTYLDELFEKE
ncbi:hypothetical protein K2173_003061 [Erythroxylum novogranatense]|uniref:Uncharacterized protein n=1 Tax=Erythroxylum novogranatense TaxID=1862640 RepID=A0AAV8S8P0_9ROSI|nr:hypothetical protein K2173_003061 [Erythroxylum novogranatense]